MTADICIPEIKLILEEKGGNITRTAQHFKVSRQTIYNRIKSDRIITYKNLEKMRGYRQAEIAEEAILKLEDAVQKGERWAIERILDSRHGSYLGYFRLKNQVYNNEKNII